MLLQLRVQNLAVMDRAEAALGPGLNALTGETGAGKSVLLTALGLCLGGRAEGGLVRRGAERAVVSAAFSGVGETAATLLDGLGVAADEVLVLAREVQPSGRSQARVNGSVVPVTSLRDLGQELVAFHGQGTAWGWLQEPRQRSALDAYAGLGALLRELELGFGRHRELSRRLRQRRESGERLRAELEQARLDLAELEAAGLSPGELERLLEERSRLQHSARLRMAAEELRAAAGAEQLATALQRARGVEGLDSQLDPLLREADDIQLALSELRLSLGSYLEGLPQDAERLTQVEERLDQLDRVGRRHGGTVAAAIRRREEAAQLLAEHAPGRSEEDTLAAELATLEVDCCSLCAQLSERRARAAAALASSVTEELRRLLMPRARFAVRLWQEESPDGLLGPAGARFGWQPWGWDRISFDFAANAGDPLRPLAATASGGELSRVVLVVVSVLSAVDPSTLVFDEVDEGLGGEAANRVGKLLQELGKRQQVLCVTHLATVAARANTHLVVTKRESADRATTRVQVASGPARVAELARLLAGDATPEAAQSHARELLLAVGEGANG